MPDELRDHYLMTLQDKLPELLKHPITGDKWRPSDELVAFIINIAEDAYIEGATDAY